MHETPIQILMVEDNYPDAFLDKGNAQDRQGCQYDQRRL